MSVIDTTLTKISAMWGGMAACALHQYAAARNAWINKGIYFAKALLWVGFILFFTFTDLVVAAALTDVDFNESFYASQAASIALIVNIGLVVMLVIDLQISTPRHPSRKLLFSVMFAMALAVLAYLHAKANMANSLERFNYPISDPTLSIMLFGIFILTIAYIKYSTLVPLRPIKILE